MISSNLVVHTYNMERAKQAVVITSLQAMPLN